MLNGLDTGRNSGGRRIKMNFLNKMTEKAYECNGRMFDVNRTTSKPISVLRYDVGIRPLSFATP